MRFSKFFAVLFVLIMVLTGVSQADENPTVVKVVTGTGGGTAQTVSVGTAYIKDVYFVPSSGDITLDFKGGDGQNLFPQVSESSALTWKNVFSGGFFATKGIKAESGLTVTVGGAGSAIPLYIMLAE